LEDLFSQPHRKFIQYHFGEMREKKYTLFNNFSIGLFQQLLPQHRIQLFQQLHLLSNGKRRIHLIIIPQKTLQPIGEIILDRKAPTNLIGNGNLLLQRLIPILQLTQRHPNNIDHIPKNRSPNNLHNDDHNHLVLILRGDIPVADGHHRREGPVQGEDVFGLPAGEVQGFELVQPGELLVDAGADEVEGEGEDVAHGD
jgi:hypothetical protein